MKASTLLGAKIIYGAPWLIAFSTATAAAPAASLPADRPEIGRPVLGFTASSKEPGMVLDAVIVMRVV